MNRIPPSVPLPTKLLYQGALASYQAKAADAGKEVRRLWDAFFAEATQELRPLVSAHADWASALSNFSKLYEAGSEELFVVLMIHMPGACPIRCEWRHNGEVGCCWEMTGNGAGTGEPSPFSVCLADGTDLGAASVNEAIALALLNHRRGPGVVATAAYPGAGEVDGEPPF